MRELILILVSGLISMSLYKEYLKLTTPHRENEYFTEFDSLDGDDDVFNDERSYQTQNYQFSDVFWPQIKNALCPDMVPNLSLAKSRIFQLARERLHFFRGYQEILVKQQEEDDVYNRFFDFHASINTYDPDKNDLENTVLGYVGVWKCANNQIRWAMNGSLGDGFDFEGRANFTLYFHHELPRMTNKKPCLVTALRDPISHFLSGYNEIEWRYHLLRLKMEDNPQLTFTRYRLGSRKRFEQFVSDFLSGPIAERQRTYLDYPLELPHVFLMSGILTELSRFGANLTDYLPTLHDLGNAWPQFLTDSCPDVAFPEDFITKPMDVTGQHQSSRDDFGNYLAAKEVWEEEGLTAEVLCILHVMDYACFDKLEIPLFCQQVYDEDFVLALTSDDFQDILRDGTTKDGM